MWNKAVLMRVGYPQANQCSIRYRNRVGGLVQNARTDGNTGSPTRLDVYNRTEGVGGCLQQGKPWFRIDIDCGLLPSSR